MPRRVSIEEVTSALQSGRFDLLIDALEDERLECKSSPYQLDQDRAKFELAKDISALANGDGGIILVGIQTGEEPTSRGDRICAIRCFGQNVVDTRQYRNVASEWILPSIPGLEIGWHPSFENPTQGIVSILVPQEASREKPYLVSKVIMDARQVGSLVGFFERTGDYISHSKPAQLRERLRDGNPLRRNRQSFAEH
jgi:predicted HTH transcriptional regulator